MYNDIHIYTTLRTFRFLTLLHFVFIRDSTLLIESRKKNGIIGFSVDEKMIVQKQCMAP